MKHEPMTQERLEAIRARLADVGAIWKYAATPTGDGEVITVGQEGPIAWGIDIDSAALIAHAPQDLTDLLAEVERLRALLTVDEDMVERAAGTLFKQDFLERNPWADDARAQHSLDQVRVSTPKAWGQYLQVVRAALDAALGTGEGA